MLETLISSRIRRTLLEHLLANPQQRFYLRGLAKELELSISPLRRELKRLEHAGMLTAIREANILFYTINTNAPTFLQLKHAMQHPPADASSVTEASKVLAQANIVTSVRHIPFSRPAMVAALGLGMTLVLLTAGLCYMTISHQHMVSHITDMLTRRIPDIQVDHAAASSGSGVMHGMRWRLIPGGFGGMSTRASEESY